MKRSLLALALIPGCTPAIENDVIHIAPGTSPNIVVIMTDDLDKRSMEEMIALGLAPNIQSLRDDGTEFPNYFISNTLCCPSRATALSGQYSHNNGVTGEDPDDNGGGVEAFDDSSTLVTWLQSEGYRTGHVGKYLNGYGTEKNQTTPSFQDDYIPPGWNHWMATIGGGTYRMFKYKIHDSREGVVNIQSYGYTGGVQTANYQTTILAQKAVTFIDESIDLETPFYLEVMPVAPHAEAGVPSEGKWDWSIRHDPQDDIDKATQIAQIYALPLAAESDPSFDYVTSLQPNFIRNRDPLETQDITNLTEFYRDRLAAMLAVDDLVGDIVDELTDEGVLDNTVIFFTSDNGFLFGQHRLAGKRVAFDEATNVPLYVLVPDRDITTTPKFISNVDLAPTIAELAGAEPGLIQDGQSLMPFLSQEVPLHPWRRRAFLEHWSHGESDVPTYAGLRTSKWLFTNYYESTVQNMNELYDLMLDPYQTTNVYTDPEYQDIVDNLQGFLDVNMFCAGEECHAIEAE